MAADFDQRVEHGLQVEGRTADHLEYVGGGGLLLQRFGEIVGALAQLVEQPGILDGDDGLTGEARQQFDLLVGEGTNLLAIDGDRADQLVLLEHGHDDLRARTRQPGRRGRDRLRGLVDAVDHGSRLQDAVEGIAGLWQEAAARPDEIAIGRRRIEYGRRVEGTVVVAVQHAELGLANARGVLQHGLEYRRQLAGRAGNDLQHLGGCGLLLQRFAQLARARLHLVEQAHVLDRDHRLVGEGGDELDLPVGEWANLVTRQYDHADRAAFAQERNAENGPIIA